MSDTPSSALSAQNPRNLRETFDYNTTSALDTLGKLSIKLEDSFLTLGHLLSDIRRCKAYKLKGYDTFKAYLETEHRFPSALAAKLISIYDLFVGEMDLDEIDIVSIGFERLNLIRPLMKDADIEMREELVSLALNQPIPELRETIQERKALLKADEAPTDLKTIFTDQFLERFTTALNCSRKELDFKLALFFQDYDPEAVKAVVKAHQRAFESQLTQSAESAPQSAQSAGNQGDHNAQR